MRNGDPRKSINWREVIAIWAGVAGIVGVLFTLWNAVFTIPRSRDVEKRLQVTYYENCESFVGLTKELFQIDDVYETRTAFKEVAEKVAPSLGRLAHTIIQVQEFLSRYDRAFNEMEASSENMDLSYAMAKVLFWTAMSKKERIWNKDSVSVLWNNMEPWLGKHMDFALKKDTTKVKYNYFLKAQFHKLKVRKYIIFNHTLKEVKYLAKPAFTNFNEAARLHQIDNPDSPLWPDVLSGKMAVAEDIWVAHKDTAYLDSLNKFCKQAKSGLKGITPSSPEDEIRLYLNVAENYLCFYECSKAGDILKDFNTWCKVQMNVSNPSDEIKYLCKGCRFLEVTHDIFELFRDNRNLDLGVYYGHERRKDVLQRIANEGLLTSDYAGYAIDIMSKIMDCQYFRGENDLRSAGKIWEQLKDDVDKLEEQGLASKPKRLLGILISSVKKAQQGKCPDVYEEREKLR